MVKTFSPKLNIVWRPFIRTQMYFPDKRLLQYDCGKLQKMAQLLKTLKENGHKVLIFTQMSKMLDILEAFLCIHGYLYFRLDGATKVDKRQYYCDRFNTDPKIFAFILSTRSGGLGLNLTGADTVIFYDSDWNPAMDAQAQDRCHRIGQTRDVHIYRLITESTIEERILTKANQKRQLNNLVIQSGYFTPDFFKNMDVNDLFNVNKDVDQSAVENGKSDQVEEDINEKDIERLLSNTEDKEDVDALKRAKQEEVEAQNNQEVGDNDERQAEEKKEEDGLLPIHK